MLTTKKPAQIFLIFSLGFVLIAGWTGCAPAGARALQKGERLLKEGKYSEAVAKFEEATKALPNNAKAWNHLGLGYQYAGDSKKAGQAYRQALTLDRNLAAARYNLGVLYLEERNYSAAISELTTFTQLDSKNPDGWLKLGNAQMQLASLVPAEKNRHLDAAKKSFDAAYKLRPSAEVLNAMGLVQIQRGRPRDAVPNFTAALQQQTNYAPALLNLAVVYHQHLNERRLALMNYQQFISVAKNSPNAAQVQAVIRQLHSELNPQVAVANPAPVIASQSPPVTNNFSATTNPSPVKSETNVPKTAVIIQKPDPIISAPKPQPSPPVKKETPLEVATLPEEVAFKPAQDVLPTNKPNVTFTSPVVANPVRPSHQPEKGSGMLTKLNPARWFKGTPKATTPMTELPAPKPAIDTSAPVLVEQPKPMSRIAAKASDARSAPVIPRYKYRSPKKPGEGKRAEADPIFQRGVQAQKDRRLADALAAYREAIKSDPSFFEANYNLALAAREAGDFSAALGAYEQSLAIMPESVNARYNFAFTLQEAGYFHDAATELRKLLEQNPNETRGHLLLGNLCAQRLDQASMAREHYLKVLEAEPNHPQATQIRYWLAAHP